MTHNIIPPTMRARHFETGEWHTLSLSDTAIHYGCPVSQSYHEDDCEGGHWVDLNDFEQFEAKT